MSIVPLTEGLGPSLLILVQNLTYLLACVDSLDLPADGNLRDLGSWSCWGPETYDVRSSVKGVSEGCEFPNGQDGPGMCREAWPPAGRPRTWTRSMDCCLER